MFEGYTVGAMGYLVKPVKQDKLRQVLDRAQKLFEERRPETFTIQNAEGLYRIAKKEILYLFSERRLVKVRTETREYAYYGKLDDAKKRSVPVLGAHAYQLAVRSVRAQWPR